MIEGEFESAKSAEAIGFSDGEFGFVVETLYDTAGNEFVSAKVVEDKFAMLAERASDLFHRVDAGAHGLAAPFVEELARPGRRVIVPKLLKGLLEKISANGFEVVAKQIAEAKELLVREVL